MRGINPFKCAGKWAGRQNERDNFDSAKSRRDEGNEGQKCPRIRQKWAGRGNEGQKCSSFGQGISGMRDVSACNGPRNPGELYAKYGNVPVQDPAQHLMIESWRKRYHTV